MDACGTFTASSDGCRTGEGKQPDARWLVSPGESLDVCDDSGALACARTRQDDTVGVRSVFQDRRLLGR
jgi:hypothetical protein